MLLEKLEKSYRHTFLFMENTSYALKLLEALR